LNAEKRIISRALMQICLSNSQKIGLSSVSDLPEALLAGNLSNIFF